MNRPNDQFHADHLRALQHENALFRAAFRLLGIDLDVVELGEHIGSGDYVHDYWESELRDEIDAELAAIREDVPPAVNPSPRERTVRLLALQRLRGALHG